MNERTGNVIEQEDELQRQKELPQREDGRSDARREAEGRPEPAVDGKMSTADLAYGRDSRTDGESPLGMVGDVTEPVTLIREEDAGGFRDRWTSIQTHFIDEPRETVGGADELVAEVIQSLARRFAEERQSLEQQWQSGTEVSTEDLRLAMQHYRSFFERLLAA